MKNHIHMLDNQTRLQEAVFLASVLCEDSGITLTPMEHLLMARCLIEFFDILDRETDFSWDDLPRCTNELVRYPEESQLLLPCITPQDMKKWEVLKKKYRKEIAE